MSKPALLNEPPVRACVALALQIFTAAASANGPSGLIVTDGSLGAAGFLHNPQTLSTSNNTGTVTITQDMGATVGANLFHSFSEFNINTGQSVIFTENSYNALDNVIARVTGADPSLIDGTLQSALGHANFYFINPNGVTFTANAQINVPAAFHVGSANSINFPGGGSFQADLSQSSVLSSQAPAAFGFLATTQANNGLIDVNGAQLAVQPGQRLDVAAGGVSLKTAPP